METILTALLPQLLPLLGIILAVLATWGIAILKTKIGNDFAKTALDQVDQVTTAVVGHISQTLADGMKTVASDGKLTEAQKIQLKATAIGEIQNLLSTEVKGAAEKAVTSLQAYIAQKIEEQVLAQKK
ncbi:MAG: hypothetical protein NTY64_22980 [Deltaproteobacteria bacterium]|nr:hypothetical protein [Deltaproteobacteria bacterium]